MSHHVNRLVAGLVLAGCTHLAHAAGFALIEQSASGLGNAYAGGAAAAPTESSPSNLVAKASAKRCFVMSLLAR